MTFVISDLHFDDCNVLCEYNRPFDSVSEMNEEIIDRWNQIVCSQDTVYHVGDFTVKDTEAAVLYRIEQLSGNIILLDGNHRPIQRSEFARSALPIQRSAKLEYGGYEFFLTHKPAWIPDDWGDWAITGHHHDAVEDYPFVDPESRMVNISAEVLDYRPLNLDRLVDIIETGERYETYADVQ